MSEIKPGATVLNIASKCPKCQTTFTQETNVYDLAVRQLTERAEKAANITTIQQKQIERLLDARDAEVLRREKAEAACAEMREFIHAQPHTRGCHLNKPYPFSDKARAEYDTKGCDCGKDHALSSDCGKGYTVTPPMKPPSFHPDTAKTPPRPKAPR